MALNKVNLYRIDGSLGSVGNIQTSALNGGALAGTRNRIINGDMRIAQRGASFPAAANAYNLDRWQWSKSGAMVCTISQDSDVPNNTFQNSYKVNVTTADTSVISTDYAVVIHKIEGYNVRDLIGTTFTLSFWVKSPKIGTHCVGLRNGTLSACFVATYSITAANTWEYKTITVTGGLVEFGTWDWTNGGGLEIDFVLVSGTNYQTSANNWQAGGNIATSSQVNVMDSTANNFFLTGVQLEPGTVATPFERRNYGQELGLCQRYYREVTLGGGGYTISSGAYFSLDNMDDMRALPTFATSAGYAFAWFDGTSWTATNVGATFAMINAGANNYLLQVGGLTGNGTFATPTTAVLYGFLSAEL
jgi:hypothetical protein